MATTPPTFVADTELAAADLNLLRDCILELQARADGSDYMAVQVSRAATQSIPDSTSTPLSFDTQVFDIGNVWSSGTDLVIPASWIPAGATTIGIRIFGGAAFGASSTGLRTISFLKNGATFGGDTQSATVGASVQAIEVEPTVEAGDIITVEVEQTSGGSLTARGTFTVERTGVTA